MKVGDTVENFRLKDQFGNDFDLYDNLTQDILLVFYPKDNTLVCTKQLVDYSDNQNELQKLGLKIIGVNIDPVESHNSFCSNNKIDFPVLSDPQSNVSRTFDALNILGQNKRKLVLIGKDKKLRFVRSTLPVFFLDTKHLMNELRKMQPL